MREERVQFPADVLRAAAAEEEAEEAREAAQLEGRATAGSELMTPPGTAVGPVYSSSTKVCTCLY